MNPTPTELALIAAALSKGDGSKPEDNISAAAELWSKCSASLDEKKEIKGRARFIADCKMPAMMTLKDFLKEKMPKIKTPALRQTRFHQFLVADYLPKQPRAKLFEGGINTLAGLFIEEAKKSGVSANAYPGLAEWCMAKASAGHATGAKIMHEKRRKTEAMRQIEQAANRKAKQTKSRIEFHDPETLARIAEKQQKAGG